MTRGRSADLVVEGRIATLAGAAGDGFGWVGAIAVADGRVVAAGTRDDVEAIVGPRTRHERLAPDEVAIPALTDAHLHLADAGIVAGELDLSSAPSLEAALTAIADVHRRLPPSAWLEGAGWDVSRWGAWPTAAALETIAPGRAAALWAHDHHALWVSPAALDAARIDARTADPAGGHIRRLADGAPAGVLHERAASLVVAVAPQPSVEAIEAGIRHVGRELVALGVLGVHDPGSDGTGPRLGDAFAAYRRLADRGELPVRVHLSVRDVQLEAAIAAGCRSGEPLGADGHLRFGWLKLFADGTLGSRTAALLDPYEPTAGADADAGGWERGLWMTEPAELRRLVAHAAEHGIVSQIHAIGDAAVRAALDTLAAVPAAGPLLPRVEHAQLVDPADVPRFARLGVAASVQPVHLRADGPGAARAWGPRAERAGYPYRALAAAGALVAFGTDAPVEPIDPWPGLELAVTRRSDAWPPDAAPLGPGQALPLAVALRAQCAGGPQSAGDADRGRLTVGSVADVVVLPAEALGEPVEVGGLLGRARPRRVFAAGQFVAG